MKSTLYIPQKLVVGFKPRTDTFTNRLGFVTYKDDKGLLKQEKSWEGWRDKNINPEEFDNIPQDHFLFNKDVKRYSHWGNTNKVRIYDPRDFEVEIDMTNVMFLLMHSDVSKRDIAQECVYAWNGQNLVLLPTNSQEYLDSIEHTKKKNTKFSLKDLEVGHTYCTKDSREFVYLGYYDWSEEVNWGLSSKKFWENKGKKHIFYNLVKQYKHQGDFLTLTANELCEKTNEIIHENFSHYLEQLMQSNHVGKYGEFCIKKGFDKVGYKYYPYETLEVTLYQDGYKTFELNNVEFTCENDRPEISRKKSHTNSYYSNSNKETMENTHRHNMSERGYDPEKVEDVKNYFEKLGFGTLYYKDLNGTEVAISFI